MELWVQLLVAVAALLYITERFATMFAETLVQDATQVLDKIKQLHIESSKLIEPTFELWWEDKRTHVGAQLSKGILEDIRAQLPDSLPDDMLTAITKALSEDALAGLKNAAFHLAVHAHMGTKEMDLMHKLPKKVREVHEERQQQRAEDLDAMEVRLLAYGITAEEIKVHFAQAK